jgi:hypothetical protein
MPNTAEPVNRERWWISVTSFDMTALSRSAGKTCAGERDPKEITCARPGMPAAVGRRMANHAWLLLGLVGCAVPPLDLDLDHRGPHVDLYDDGVALRVTGCSDAGFLGCNAAAVGVTMTVTAGGLVQEVPQRTADAIVDQLLGLFGDGPFQLTIATPADGQVGLELAGVATTVTLPPPFAVSPPADHVSRASGPITITHEVLDGGITQGLVITTCGARQRTDLVDEALAGQLVIAFDAFSAADGACSHEIHVDQTVAADSSALPARAVRIDVVTMTSEP